MTDASMLLLRSFFSARNIVRTLPPLQALCCHDQPYGNKRYRMTRRDTEVVLKRTLWFSVLACCLVKGVDAWHLTSFFSGSLGSVQQGCQTTTRLLAGRANKLIYPVNMTDSISAASFVGIDDNWRSKMGMAYNPYRSKRLQDDEEWENFMKSLEARESSDGTIDPFWKQIRYEAKCAVKDEPEAGPQVHQGILSQPSLLVAIVTVIAHQLETELIPAVQLKNLFLSLLTPQDEFAIRLDLEAVATRSPSVEGALPALLFHNGFHALTAYRVAHELWKADRKALAYYMQSVVSRKYSADIHPASTLGYGLYLRVGGGVVIGETAVVGNDVSILEGVTLGGTGKESGDRHPKVGNGVIIYDGGTVLGNIRVNDGAVVRAKSIVTKNVPPLAIMQGVPAKVTEYRKLTPDAFEDDLQAHLWRKYVEDWKVIMRNAPDLKHPSRKAPKVD